MLNLRSVAPVLLAALTGCTIQFHGFGDPSHWIEETESHVLEADGVELLEIETHNGRVEVRSRLDGRDEVTALLTIRAGGDSEEDALDCMDAILVVAEVSGSRCRLGWRWDGRRHSDWGAEVSFEVEVPPALAASLSTHNGPIRVVGLEGDLTVSTHNGRMELDVASRNVAADSHNGGIELCGAPAHVRLETHNGAIEVTLEGRGELSGSIETHNGAVLVHALDGYSTRIEASTHNGGLACDVEGAETDLRKRDMTVRLGDAQERLRITTHNGSIRLR